MITQVIEMVDPFFSTLLVHDRNVGGGLPLRVPRGLLRSRGEEIELGGHPQGPPRMGCAPATPTFLRTEFTAVVYWLDGIRWRCVAAYRRMTVEFPQ
jgi:hypothetical protein